VTPTILRSFLVSIGIVSLSYGATPTIILYPPDYALITQPTRPTVTAKGLVFAPLPAGIMPQYFSIQGVSGPISLSGFVSTDNSNIHTTSPLPRMAIVSGVAFSTPTQWSSVVNSLPSSVTYALILGPTLSTFNAILNVSNRSEMSFSEAKVEIKIGDGLFAASGPGPRPMMMKAIADMSVVGTSGPSHYFYALTQPVTIPINDTVNIPLFSYDRLRVNRICKFDGGRWGNTEFPVQLDQELRFQNTTGYPIAPGTVQIMSEGRLVAIGSIDAIRDDGLARVQIGPAIDVTATRKSTSTQAEKSRLETIEIQLSNASNKVATIESIEPYWGTVEVLSASQGYKRTANRIQFETRLGPKEVQTIALTLKYSQP